MANREFTIISHDVLQNFKLVIRDRSGLLFEGTVEAVSSFNRKGPFDILPLHINFISVIERMLTIHIGRAVLREIPIKTGVLIVRENNVEVYLGIIHE